MAQNAKCVHFCDSDRFGISEYHALIDQATTLFGLQHLFWATFGNDHLPVRRDNDLIAINFPAIDRKLYSPAFLWPETVPVEFRQGKKNPTDETTHDRFVQSLLDRNHWIRCHRCNFVSNEGLDYSYLLLSSSSSHKSDGKRTPCRKLRVWLQSGVHGNEPAGDQSVLALLGRMDLDQFWTNSILAHMDIVVLLRYNADGAADFNRTSALGTDLNRDHIKLGMPESRGIKKLFCEFAPHVAIDMHEYSAKARVGKYAHGSDIMFAAAKNLNIHPNIRQLSETLFATNLGQSLTKAGFRWAPYVPTNGILISFTEAGSDGKIGRNAVGLTQCISILAEVRGIGIADQHFHRRTAAGLTFIENMLETVAQNAELVFNTVEESVRNFITGKADIVMSDKPTAIERTFTMIETRTGNLVQLPVKYLSNTPAIPTMTRPRPEAYLIPASLPQIVDGLRCLGLNLERAEHSHTSLVEVLTITSATFDRTYFEGIVPIKVNTVTVEKVVSVPAGTYIVSTRQRNAALAFIALEPENVDSYVSSNILPILPGEEYPIYRMMTTLTM